MGERAGPLAFLFRKTRLGALFALLTAWLLDANILPLWVGLPILAVVVAGAFCDGFNAHARLIDSLKDDER